jgi:peptide/nickel transport system permease protein
MAQKGGRHKHKGHRNRDADRDRHQSNLMITAHRLYKDKVALGGLIAILVLVFLGIAAPLLSKYDYSAVDPVNAKLGPTLEHFFGTDELGRDIFARCLMGARYSLFLGFSSELSAVVVGVLIGGFAGFVGGKVDNLVMRFCDVIQSIPAILLTITMSTALGRGFVTTIIALAISGVPANIRVMRAQVLKIREEEYVEGAKAITVSMWSILTKYIIPNGWAPIIVGCTMGIGGKIQSAAGLSYLGLGIQPPTPEWGAMLSAAKTQLRYAPHMLIFPGLFIIITTFAFNLFGEGLRDASDPKLRT